MISPSVQGPWGGAAMPHDGGNQAHLSFVGIHDHNVSRRRQKNLEGGRVATLSHDVEEANRRGGSRAGNQWRLGFAGASSRRSIPPSTAWPLHFHKADVGVEFRVRSARAQDTTAIAACRRRGRGAIKVVVDEVEEIPDFRVRERAHVGRWRNEGSPGR